MMVAQLLAMSAWHQSCPPADDPSVGTSREATLDRQRHKDILEAVRTAMQHQAASQLASEPLSLISEALPRAVVAHQDEWFADRLSQALEEYGIQMVARLRWS